ncbi:hypothetical protein NFI96_004559 [Prochilodus magdalenae]|nr:hypothetical protein NFI96_004559 [Prochilodus magdalenae]
MLGKGGGLFELLKVQQLDVAMVQEMHSDGVNEVDWQMEWEGRVVLGHGTSSSAGVAVLFSRSFLPQSYDYEEVVEGMLWKITARVDHGGKEWIKPGLKKYSWELTLDPNTAHRRLSLCEENRKVVWAREEQSYPDHPERFDYWEQVLCRESLTGRCYWEGSLNPAHCLANGIRRSYFKDLCSIGVNSLLCVTASKMLILCRGLQRVAAERQTRIAIYDPRFKTLAFTENRAVDAALQRIPAAAATAAITCQSSPLAGVQDGEEDAGHEQEKP